jgi:hypothetical protein
MRWNQKTALPDMMQHAGVSAKENPAEAGF